MYLNTVITEVLNHPQSTFIIWGGAFIVGTMGFLGARFRPWLAVPIVGLAVYLTYDLTPGFADVHAGTSRLAENARDAVLHIFLAAAIVIFATGQGVRLWAVGYNKRYEQTSPDS